MKIITAESFNSVHMLIFYIVMNSLYKINQVKASVTAGSVGASSNGKWSDVYWYFYEGWMEQFCVDVYEFLWLSAPCNLAGP